MVADHQSLSKLTLPAYRFEIQQNEHESRYLSINNANKIIQFQLNYTL